MGFPLTWSELREYLRTAGNQTDMNSSSELSIKLTKEPSAFEPWYEFEITRDVITKDGREFKQDTYSTTLKFSGAQLYAHEAVPEEGAGRGIFNAKEVDIRGALDCRVRVDEVRRVCEALKIDTPDPDLFERVLESTVKDGDTRKEYVNAKGETTRVEILDFATGQLEQTETFRDGKVERVEVPRGVEVLQVESPYAEIDRKFEERWK